MGSWTGILLLALIGFVWSATVPRKADSVTEGTELVYAFLTHRHGDRTPIESSMAYLGLNDYTEVKQLIEPWGYGQLTDAGKRTAYQTGQFIRRRYGDFISTRFNKSEVYIRSTDSTRTKMTVLAALSAIFPAQDDSWSKDINWDPVPYTTVPAKWDFNEAIVNCPVFLALYYADVLKTNSRMDPYKEVLAKLSQVIGIDITQMPAMVSSVYDVYVSVNSLGYPIDDAIKELLPALEEAAGVAWDITFGDEDNIALGAGVFLNEFFNYADQVIAGEDTQKLRIYSAHDANVYLLETISKLIPKQGAPKYGSLLSLELRKVVATGQYVVLPVYLRDPHVGEEVYLQVDGCGYQLCDYDTFRSLTSSFLRDEDTWRTECGFSSDMEFDTSGID